MFAIDRLIEHSAVQQPPNVKHLYLVAGFRLGIPPFLQNEIADAGIGLLGLGPGLFDKLKILGR